MDQHAVSLDCFKPRTHRIPAFRAADYDRGYLPSCQGSLQQRFLAFADHDTDGINGRVRRKRVNRMRDQRFATQQRKLLGERTACAFALPGGNDKGSYVHRAGHTGFATSRHALEKAYCSCEERRVMPNF
jgi:hypothetical protein